jgi:cytosine/uracil/thiamine/allantoin permease
LGLEYWGWSIQAPIPYVVGVALPLPGFIGNLGVYVSQTATDMGHMGWRFSFVVSTGLSLSLLCLDDAESKGIEEDESQV